MIKSLPKNLLIGVLSLLCFVNYSKAQDNPLAPAQASKPFYVGPIFGYNRVMHNTNKPSIPLALDDVPCPNFENGSANGFFAGASFEYMLGDAANSKSSIIIRAMYSTLPSYFEQQGDDLPTTVGIVNQDGSVTPTEAITSINYLNDITYNVLALDALFKFNFINAGNIGLGVVAGPTFDYSIKATELNRLKLVSPENAALIRNEEAAAARGWIYPDDDPQSLIFNEGDILNSNGIRVGLKVGAQMEISFPKFVIVPNVMYNLGLTQLTPDFDWRVNVLQIGVDVRFAVK
jgi:hypothetical protein